MARRYQTERVTAGTLLAVGCLLVLAVLGQPIDALAEESTAFRRIPAQYIAALGDPDATSGDNAQLWGLWRRDPGLRGVPLARYGRLKATGGIAPARWQFDSADWWLEENGLIMEAPTFSVPAGKYVVTGNREVVSVLTIHPKGADGTQRWELDDGATLYDVTHLRCRSARYTPATPASESAGQTKSRAADPNAAADGSCSPANAPMTAFPVTPGGPMPPIAGCNKQDYTVLIVIGVGVER